MLNANVTPEIEELMERLPTLRYSKGVICPMANAISYVRVLIKTYDSDKADALNSDCQLEGLNSNINSHDWGDPIGEGIYTKSKSIWTNVEIDLLDDKDVDTFNKVINKFKLTDTVDTYIYETIIVNDENFKLLRLFEK